MPASMSEEIRSHVWDLSDGELYRALKDYGVPVGPVVDSTRQLYRRKLADILLNEQQKDEEPNEHDLEGVSSELLLGRKLVPPPENTLDDCSWRFPELDPVSSRRITDVESELRISDYVSSDQNLSEPGCSWMNRSPEGTDTRHSVSGATWRTTGTSESSLSAAVRGEQYFSQSRDEGVGYSVRERNVFTDSDMRRELADRYQLTSLMRDNNSRPSSGLVQQQRSSMLSLKAVIIVVIVGCVLCVLLLMLVFAGSDVFDPYQEIEDAARRAIEDRKNLPPKQ